MLQVPPDFYIPDFDEDEQNPDERMDRKWFSKQIQDSHTIIFHIVAPCTLFGVHEFSSSFSLLIDHKFSFQSILKTSIFKEMMNIMKGTMTMIITWMLLELED